MWRQWFTLLVLVMFPCIKVITLFFCRCCFGWESPWLQPRFLKTHASACSVTKLVMGLPMDLQGKLTWYAMDVWQHSAAGVAVHFQKGSVKASTWSIGVFSVGKWKKCTLWGKSCDLFSLFKLDCIRMSVWGLNCSLSSQVVVTSIDVNVILCRYNASQQWKLVYCAWKKFWLVQSVTGSCWLLNSCPGFEFFRLNVACPSKKMHVK